MRLELRMGCYMAPVQRQTLSLAQKQGLTQLFELQQTLVHPEFPNAVKGFDGMIEADRLLKNRGARGVLIGGLSEAVWNQRRTKEQLASHKDVDVMVADPNFNLNEPFEGGIDWWLPREERLHYSTDSGSAQNVTKRWYENGNDVILGFRIDDVFNNPRPGLYILDPEAISQMRGYETAARVDYGRVNVEFGEEVFEKFRDKVKKRMGKRVPSYIRNEFQGQILGAPYNSNTSLRGSFNIVRGPNLESTRQINRGLGRVYASHSLE